MLCVGIDVHLRQLTLNCRDESGDVVCARQVSTVPDKCAAFFLELHEKHGSFIAVIEVCGFTDWLVEQLPEWGCSRVILVQPTKKSAHKTDRRDAARLSELLWTNRQRLMEGKRLNDVRQVAMPSKEDAAARQLTAMVRRLKKQRTQTINSIHHLLAKHNLRHQQPTKGIQTKAARSWLASLELPEVDAFEMKMLLQTWELIEKQLEDVGIQLRKHFNKNDLAIVLRTVPGLSLYGSLTIACRLGPGIHAFPSGSALANFWGLTPGSDSSGESKRLGSITKQGSSIVRSLLGNAVASLLKKDQAMRAWYQKVKRRRGGKIAIVAVMRKLATIIWRMLTFSEPYVCGGPVEVQNARETRRVLQRESIGASSLCPQGDRPCQA